VWKEWEEMDEWAKEGLSENYKRKGIIAEEEKPSSKKPDTKGGK
jgi:hypothetical protein